MNYKNLVRLTEAAMNDPQVGDRFSEMLSFWVYVVHRDGERIATLEGGPPVTFPEEGELREYKDLSEFKDHFSGAAGYWILLCDRENDVEGWYDQ